MIESDPLIDSQYSQWHLNTQMHAFSLDCTLGSAGLIRRCLMEASNHLLKRVAFDVRLFDAWLMQNVISQMVSMWG